jgi:hypothetical protein
VENFTAAYGGGGRFNPRATGPRGTTRAPLGPSAAYDGNNLQWCTGVSGTKTAAKAAAKNQQAAAKANQATAANPQSKPAEDEKLKKRVEATNAAVKEADREKAKGRDKPEPIRRRTNASGQRNRNPPPQVQVDPAAGVSGADTARRKGQ